MTYLCSSDRYSVTFFLYKFHVRTSSIKRGKYIPCTLKMGSLIDSRRPATGLAERLRQIFYIAAANFVFPLLLNISQILCISVFQSSAGTMLLLVNNYVPVIGILCATIWFSGTDRVHARSDSSAELAHSERTGSRRRELFDAQNGHTPRFTVDLTNSSPGSVMQSKPPSPLPHADGSYVFRHYT